MSRKSLFGVLLGGTALGIAAILSGCTSETASSDAVPRDAAAATQAAPVTPAAESAATDEQHAHKPGAHGGIIVPIGRDSYHAEAVFEKGEKLRLFMLGQDEGRVQEVEVQTLTAYAKPEGGTDSVSFALEPERLPDDAAGKTSQFVGTLPEGLAGRPVEVTIPNLRVNGERFRLGFASVSEHEEGHDEEMPEKLADDAEVALFLTPGGLYTDADIEANGRMTGSQKFKGLRAKHDVKPQPGDKLCPISMTKANPQFSWVIGGKTYEFCCPPCVEEFLSQAKAGEEIGEPEDYVKE